MQEKKNSFFTKKWFEKILVIEERRLVDFPVRRDDVDNFEADARVCSIERFRGLGRDDRKESDMNSALWIFPW